MNKKKKKNPKPFFSNDNMKTIPVNYTFTSSCVLDAFCTSRSFQRCATQIKNSLRYLILIIYPRGFFGTYKNPDNITAFLP